MDGREVVTVRLGLLESGQVCVNDAVISGKTENQCDIDRDARCNHLGNCRQTLDRRGNLDHDIVATDPLIQFSGLLNGFCGIERQRWLDLDGHSTVYSVRCNKNVVEDVTRGCNVTRRGRENGFTNGGAIGRKVCHLLSVGCSGRECSSEDGGVCRDANDVLLRDQAL